MKCFVSTIGCLLLIIMTPGLYAAEDANSCQDYDVFVMRHLEKESSNDKDPGLNAEGRTHAKQLASLPMMKNVAHAFYTPYKRTFETLEHLDATKTVYDPSEIEQLVTTVKKDFCGKTVMIVGHSNTVPNIIKAFGGRFKVSYAEHSLAKEPTIVLNENDYGSIFRVTFHNERVHQQLYYIDKKSTQKTGEQ